MCNHYTKDDTVVAWARISIRGLTIPAAFAGVEKHTYPKKPAPVVIQQDGTRSLVSKLWGIPINVKTPSGKPTIKHVTNARNDKLTGFTWRYCTAERRCLIPATGYYEPGLGPPGAKGEILFTVRSRPTFFFAGLWQDDYFTMVTTVPNEFAVRFHDRMPVVLSDADAEAWLGDQPLPPELLINLCRGLPADALDHTEFAAAPKAAPAAASKPKKEQPPPPSQSELF